MAKPKLRVRALMAVIAVVALGFWGEQMRRRRSYCLEMAAKHRSHLFLPSSRLTAGTLPNRMSFVPLTAEQLRKAQPHPADSFHWEQGQGLTAEDVETL